MQCYLTGDQLTADNRSLEHIIPNALGGVLSSRAILSADANIGLGSSLDVRFNRIFEGTYRRLPLNKDRKTKTGFTGIHQLFRQEAIYKEGRWFPRKPFYDASTNTIYAESMKIGEGYAEHLKKKGSLLVDQEIIVITDLSGPFEIPFKLDNDDFAQGMAKIAAGFAAYHGIARNDLSDVIDLEKKAFRTHDELIILPYFPVDPIAPVFELNAVKSSHYPVHAISLVGDTEAGYLFCYVELFSTFQFIVILNKNYQGETIHQTYIYDLLGAKELTPSAYLNSVLENELLSGQLKAFKKLNSFHLDEIADIIQHEPEKISMYTNMKFRQLESFTAFADIKHKINKLEQKGT